MNQEAVNAIDVLLADSLKEIAAKKPIDKITIREITDRAGVIRPTFYNHFQDKYELLEWIIKHDLLEPMRPLLDRNMVKEALMLFLSSMKKEEAFYIQAAHLEGQNSFSDMLKKAIRDIILHYADPQKIRGSRRHDWLTPEIIGDFYAESMGYVVTTWILKGMKVPEEEVVDVFIYLYTHSVPEVVLASDKG